MMMQIEIDSFSRRFFEINKFISDYIGLYEYICKINVFISFWDQLIVRSRQQQQKRRKENKQ